MVRDLPSERPQFGRRRTGDPHTIRQAARIRTSKGLGFRPSLHEHPITRVTDPVPGEPGLKQAAGLLGKAAKWVALDPALDVLQATAGATTGMHSVRTPRDLLGRERQAAGVLALNLTPTGKAARLAGPLASIVPGSGGGFFKRPNRFKLPNRQGFDPTETVRMVQGIKKRAKAAGRSFDAQLTFEKEARLSGFPVEPTPTTPELPENVIQGPWGQTPIEQPLPPAKPPKRPPQDRRPGESVGQWLNRMGKNRDPW